MLAGAAAAAVDPERLLWTPGKKLISVPALTITPAPPFLAVGDIVTFYGIRARFQVTKAAQSKLTLRGAEFAMLPEVFDESVLTALKPLPTSRLWTSLRNEFDLAVLRHGGMTVT